MHCDALLLQTTAWLLCPGGWSSSTSHTTCEQQTAGRRTHHTQASGPAGWRLPMPPLCKPVLQSMHLCVQASHHGLSAFHSAALWLWIMDKCQDPRLMRLCCVPWLFTCCRGCCRCRRRRPARGAAERHAQPVAAVRPVQAGGCAAARHPGASQGGLCKQVRGNLAPLILSWLGSLRQN